MRSRARNEASVQEVPGYYKHFGGAKHLEWKSGIDNEVFDFVDLRNSTPKNYVIGRWVLTIKTDQGKGEMDSWTKIGLPADRLH